MSNSKKRALVVDGGGDNDAEEEEGATHSLRKVQRANNNTRTSVSISSHTRVRAQNRRDAAAAAAAAFRHQMELYKNGEFQVLNRDFAAAVRDSDPVSALFLANEYIRAATLIEGKYGGVPCEVVSFGSPDMSQLGFETDKFDPPPTIVLRAGNQIRSVEAGGLHSIALSTAGIPYSWGTSDEGALGRVVTETTQEHVPMPITGFVRYVKDGVGVKEDGQIVQIALGEASSLFLSLSGSVYQCGTYRDTIELKLFKDIDMFDKESSPSGLNSTPVHVYQMPGKVLSIHAKASTNAAILEDHTVVTWGFGNCGELARSAGMTVPLKDGTYDLGRDFYYKASGPDLDLVKEHFLTPKPVHWAANPQLKRDVIAVGLGSYHIMVAARDPGQPQAKLYTSGSNAYGQLGHGDTVERHSLTLVEALAHEHIVQLAGGELFSLALSHDRKRLYSFGRADYGQLGIGVIQELGEYRDTPVLVEFPKPVLISRIEAGALHSMAMCGEHVYTWGFNTEGATGHKVEGEDVFRPRLLNLMDSIKADKTAACHVHGMSGGGQHSLLLVKRYKARDS